MQLPYFKRDIFVVEILHDCVFPYMDMWVK